jgi:hypothetical protein
MNTTIKAILALLVLATGCDDASSKPQALKDMPRDQRFYSLLNLVHTNYDPLQLDAMVAGSEVIALGTINDAVDARTIDFLEGPSNPEYTTAFEIAVSEVIKGEPSLSTLYVEIVRAAAIASEDLQAAIPSEPMVMFLTPAPDSFEGSSVTDASEELRANEPLWRFTTPQGLLRESGGGEPSLIAPLEDGPLGLFEEDSAPRDLDSLKDLVEARL